MCDADKVFPVVTVVKGLFLAFVLAVPAAPAFAQEGGHYLLVSAVGSTLRYVRARFTTGTHMAPYERRELQVPDKSLDSAALRGLERIVRAADRNATVEFMRLNPDELRDVAGHEKGPIAIGKVAAALDRLPGRERFKQVVVVTPRYVMNEREGMASKLEGIGVYIQGLDRRRPTGTDPTGELDGETEGAVKPDGTPSYGRSTKFMAPFFYAQVWVLEPRTLEVLQASERFDFIKVQDPDARALRIDDIVTPEKLGPILEAFVERAAAGAAREQQIRQVDAGNEQHATDRGEQHE